MIKLKDGKFWKIGFLLLFIILLIAIAFFAYIYGKNKTGREQTPVPLTSTQVTPTAKELSDEEAIKEAVYKKFKSDASKLKVTVSKIENGFAKGGIVEVSSEVGGGYFIAAKVDGSWIIVYDGQAQPSCSQIAPYSFPKDMVPECLDSKGGVVKR